MGRQLSSFDNTTYSYNESGIRTSKTVGEDTTEFYLNGTNVIYQTDGTNDIYFFYDRNDEIVGFKYNNNNYFYVKNTMGDITDIADSSGVVVASYTYDPWGKVTSVSGLNLVIANLNPFRYRSYYYDSDIQMYYLQTRYYDPEVGRFINCDDVNYIGLTESSVSYNPFAYCKSNPINQKDTTGTFGTPIQWAFSIIGAIVGIPFGKWIANKLGYSSGWKYWAIRAAAVAGGIALGWFSGRLVISLAKQYVVANPQICIKISAKYGYKTLVNIRKFLGLSFSFIASKVPQTWQEAEEIVRHTYNAVKYTFKSLPGLGDRRVDGYNKGNGTIYEVKYGYMSLTSFIKNEIAKDKYLLSNKIVKRVEWHFYTSQGTGKGGPSKPLLEALKKAGFYIVFN